MGNNKLPCDTQDMGLASRTIILGEGSLSTGAAIICQGLAETRREETERMVVLRCTA